MDAWTIYWITRLDSINVVVTILFVLLSAVGIIGGFVAYADDHEDLKKIIRKVWAAWCVVAVVGIVVPSTKEAAAMYVIPKIAAPENIETASAEAKEIYGMAKEWLKREMETKGGKE